VYSGRTARTTSITFCVMLVLALVYQFYGMCHISITVSITLYNLLSSYTRCVRKCCPMCADTSTAGRGSKFGEALTADRLPLITAAFVKHSWLTAVHSHVGSQGCPLDMLVAGARALVDFALHVNAAVGHKQVRLSLRFSLHSAL
jgi:hypothetical protein